MNGKRGHQSQFHRFQIWRAKHYIREHLTEPLSLERIAHEAGCSIHHFVRLFAALGGETPFEFARRIRLIAALQALQENHNGSITEIAMSIGYDTSAALNKTFRKHLNLTPTQFRKLGKAEQKAVLYDQCRPRLLSEEAMQLTTEFDSVTRPDIHFAYIERRGPFAEVALSLWADLHGLLSSVDPTTIREYLGVSGIDEARSGEDAMIYQAGVALACQSDTLPARLRQRSIKAGKYARFILVGPYAQIGMAFDHVFKKLAESPVALRHEFCIENYLNDPRATPERELITELLVPIE